MSASKFTPEVCSALVDRTAEVLPRHACRVEGLRLNTVRGWLRRARQEREGPYADFARAIGEAREAAEIVRTDGRRRVGAGRLRDGP